MLEASFDAVRNRGASISGAYQYDTGQRIRMHGLPSPDELAEMDDFLSGDVVTVQAQYAYVGDSQSEPRLATYDEESGAYLAEVPSAYLKRADTVNVYVYVMYGADAEHSRAKTMYTGSFTPIPRSAPSTDVTPDQLNAWDSLVAEVNLTLAKMNTAISETNAAATGANEAASAATNAASSANSAASRAESAASSANSAASAANSAASAANAMTAKWQGATASATTLAPGSNATVALSEANGVKKFTFGIPRGATGAQGPQGPKGDTGPAGVTFRLEGTYLYIDTV